MTSKFFEEADVKLYRKDGSSFLASEALKDAEYVLVYCSASWCPPCRTFTPVLKEFYEEFHEKKKFDVIFLSFDKNENDMLDYYEEFHGDYYCLSYRDAKKLGPQWREQYAVDAIPMLLVFENKGPTRALVTKRGREMLNKDRDGERFPWTGADTLPPDQLSILEYIRRAVMIMGILYVMWTLLPF